MTAARQFTSSWVRFERGLAGHPGRAALLTWPYPLPFPLVSMPCDSDTDEASENRAAAAAHLDGLLAALAGARAAAGLSSRSIARDTGIARATLARLDAGHHGGRLDLISLVGVAVDVRLELRPMRSVAARATARAPQLPGRSDTWTGGDIPGCDARWLVALAGAEIRCRRRRLMRSAHDCAADALLGSERTLRRWETGQPPLLPHAATIALSLGFHLHFVPTANPWRARPWHHVERSPGSTPAQLALARRHGQTAAAYTSLYQDWTTPAELVAHLREIHGRFSLDAAATSATALAGAWLGPDHPLWARRDAIADHYAHWAHFADGSGPVFLNPPHSGPGYQGDWLSRARRTAAAGRTVIAVLPARTDTTAWHTHIVGHAEIQPIRGRLRYGRPHTTPRPAPFPSALVTWPAHHEGP